MKPALKPRGRATTSRRAAVYRPQLEVLEDRLPPGDLVLGLLGVSALGELDLGPPAQPSAPSDPGPALVSRVTSPTQSYEPLTVLRAASSNTRPGDEGRWSPLASGSIASPSEMDILDNLAGVRPGHPGGGSGMVILPGGVAVAGEGGGLLQAAGRGQAQAQPLLTAARRSDTALAQAMATPPVHAATGPAAVSSAPADEAQVRENYGRLPLSFERNQGQTDAQVQFLARGHGYTLFLTPTEAVMSFQQSARAETTADVLRMQLVGANPAPQVEGQQPLPGKVNYFHGSDPSQWHLNVPTYARVEYQEVYPGIDLAYYDNQRQLEYDFIVAPGADPSVIALNFAGANQLAIGPHDDLVMHTASGEVRQSRPFLYQEADGQRQEVPGSFVLQGGQRVGFEVGAYDASRPLIIDPLYLTYSTYLGLPGTPYVGTTGFEIGQSIAVDGNQNAYVTGITTSIDFPITHGTYQGNGDAFVTVLNRTGSALVYSCYLGGAAADGGLGIAVDISGNAYVTGTTSSNNFPTTPNAFQPGPRSPARTDEDAFVTVFDAAGMITYSSYLGTLQAEAGNKIAVDNAGFASIAGVSDVFGSRDILAVQIDFNPMTPVVYADILNIPGTVDEGLAVAMDGSQNAYLTGFTDLFGTRDAYVLIYNRISAGGFTYATLIGGNGDDQGFGITVDGFGLAYVTGGTTSTDLPATPGALQPMLRGPSDAFVAVVDTNVPPLSPPIYLTYLGGSANDTGYGIAQFGPFIYVAGGTGSADYYVRNTFIPGGGMLQGPGDAFLTKIDRFQMGMAQLVDSSYLGGVEVEIAAAIAVDPMECVYLTGFTTSNNFPTTAGVLQPGPRPGGRTDFDAFVAKICQDPSSGGGGHYGGPGDVVPIS